MPKITISVIKRESDYMITAVNENGVARIRQFARDERDATHRAFGMSVVFDAFYDQLRYTVIENFNTLDHIGKHPAEARAAELTAQLATVTAERDAMRKDMARILPTLEEELGYLGSCDHDVNICSCDFRAAVETVAKHAGKQTAEQSAFERTAPVDWRDVYQGETPLGIALDGLGDEVE